MLGYMLDPVHPEKTERYSRAPHVKQSTFMPSPQLVHGHVGSCTSSPGAGSVAPARLAVHAHGAVGQNHQCPTYDHRIIRHAAKNGADAGPRPLHVLNSRRGLQSISYSCPRSPCMYEMLSVFKMYASTHEDDETNDLACMHGKPASVLTADGRRIRIHDSSGPSRLFVG